MTILFTLTVIAFAFVSWRMFKLIDRQKEIVEQYETAHIKGAARGHLGMFCTKTYIDKSRKKLGRANSKF